MTASFPPLPDEIVQLIQGGVSILAATCSKDLLPDSQRCAGLRVWPGAYRLTVLLPKATAEQNIANLRESSRIAITTSEIPTHRSVQIKGTALAIRDGGDSERELALRYGEKLRAAFAWLGIPEGVTQGLTLWPAWVVDVEIMHVFAQTPGPVAGVKLPLPAGAS